MRELVEHIVNKNFDAANETVAESFELIMKRKLVEMKKIIASRLAEQCPNTYSLKEEQLDEAPRVKIVRARIRGGKIQRRKKVSNVKGYTFRSGKLTRMSPSERRKRKLGQRRGKIKRKAKLSRALMKRKRSLMKRRAIGLR